MSDKTHACEGCGKKLSKSGYYKHRKKCPEYQEIKQLQDTPKKSPQNEQETVQFSQEVKDTPKPKESKIDPLESDSENIPVEDERPDWFNFDTGGDDATEHFPTALKMVAGQGAFTEGKKPSKEQIEAMHDTNLNILIMGLGGVDLLLQNYGRAVTLDKSLVVKHSEQDKEMVAHAQYNWLLEKGINPSAFVSTGTIAAMMTGYFIIPPVLKIRKKSKVRLLSGLALRKTGSIFSRIPFIGRFFKKRPTVPPAVMAEQVEA